MKVKERLALTMPLRLLLLLKTHWQVEVEASGRQLPELISAQKLLQYFSEFCWTVLVANQ